MHLVGLGGLVAEPFDEGLCFGNLLLLVLVGPQLLLAPFGTQVDVFVVADLIVVDLSARYFDGAVCDVIDEGAVVADHNHCALVIL